MSTFLISANIDGAQLYRLFSAWNAADAELRARYFWRNNTINTLEVSGVLDVEVPPDYDQD
jgi:hypothetical protein